MRKIGYILFLSIYLSILSCSMSQQLEIDSCLRNLQEDSTNIELRVDLAVLYSKSSDYIHAIQGYEELFYKFPLGEAKVRVQEELATLYIQTGNKDKFIKFLKEYPIRLKNIQYYNHLFDLVLQLQDIELLWFLVQYKESDFAKERPDLSPWQRTDLLLHNTSLPLADNPPGLKVFLENKVKENPRHSYPYLILEYIYGKDPNNRTRYQKELFELWTKAIKEFPDEPYPLFYLGDEYKFEKKYEIAASLYEKGLEIKEKRKEEVTWWSRSYYLTLADIYNFQEKPEAAVAVLDRMKKSIPSEPIFFEFNHMGDIYKKANRYDKALDSFESTLKQIPQDPGTVAEIIDCYLNLKQYSAAESTAIAFYIPSNESYDNLKVLKALRRIYETQDNIEKEVDTYIQIVKLNPTAFNKHSLIYGLVDKDTDSTKINKLITIFEKKIRENPEDVIIKGMLATLKLSYYKN